MFLFHSIIEKSLKSLKNMINGEFIKPFHRIFMNKNNISALVSALMLGYLCIYLILKEDLRAVIQLWKLGINADEIQILSFVIGVVICSITGLVIWYFIKEKSSDRIATPFGMIMSVFLTIYWFIPMSATGAMNANWYNIPVAVRNQYRIACLFTHSSRSWPTAHFEVLQEGETEWKEGPLEGFFDLDIFGYRSRFNRILSASKGAYSEGKSKGKLYPANRRRLQEMSDYIAGRWAINYPEDPPVQKVRLSLANHPVGKEHCMAREPWSRPPLTEIPSKYVREVGTFIIDSKNSNPSIRGKTIPKLPSSTQTSPKISESNIKENTQENTTQENIKPENTNLKEVSNEQ